MDRYVGLDAHAETCTFAVVGPSGRRLTSKVVETNGQALVEAIRSIPGRVHLCLEEGTQSARLHEILEAEVSEIAVVSPPETRGAKDDLRDAWSRAEELRVGAIRTRVYKAPKHWAGLRSAATTYRMATQDVVRVKNRLKAVLRGRRSAPRGTELRQTGGAELAQHAEPRRGDQRRGSGASPTGLTARSTDGDPEQRPKSTASPSPRTRTVQRRHSR